jgi:N-acetylglucosamine-6-phosphate deacetylase
VTAPIDATLAALERLADAIESSEELEAGSARARPIGIHLEGPFISHERRGVHPPKDLLPPSLEIFEKFWQASRGNIRVLTIAPELEGAMGLISSAAARGVCVSLGHSDADSETARLAVEAGAHHATHLFNGMRPMTHRDPGIVGEALSNSELTVEIIVDGIHLDPTVVKLTLAAKGPEGVILITDGTAATGMPDGRYHLGTFEFDVKEGVCLADGKLAGSTLTMDRAVRNVMQFAGRDLQQAVALATVNPGRSLKSLHDGMLHAGGRADIVVLSSSGEVLDTFVRGVKT